VLKGEKSKERTRTEAYKSLPRSGGGYGVWRIYSIRMSVKVVERVNKGSEWRPINLCRGLAKDMEFGNL
jgi:hypothetical protein